MDWMNNNVLRIAEVLEVHPESNSVSVRFVDDGSRVPDVPVMSSSGSTRTGTVDFPVPEVGEEEDRDLTDTERVYSMAVIAMTSTLPVCLGFVQPAVNELAFKDKPNLRVWRHASDVHTIVNDAGDIELHHPSGAYVKIGRTSEPTDLTGQDYDGKWEIRRNKDPADLFIKVGASSIRMTHDGVITITAAQFIESAAPRIIEKTPRHTTTGIHTDMRGVHCPSC
ncbi:MAG: hypothetical protein EOM22_03860 [Gammaproteobacteria bacterium]|nr:hypothetical protein [Gammaproteobacteria bacterium]